MTKLKLALRLVWCAIAGHDLRERQHSVHCFTCWPTKKRATPDPAISALIAELKADADYLEADVNARLGEHHADA